MSAPVRIAAFAVGLALLFTAATVAGGAANGRSSTGTRAAAGAAATASATVP